MLSREAILYSPDRVVKQDAAELAADYGRGQQAVNIIVTRARNLGSGRLLNQLVD